MEPLEINSDKTTALLIVSTKSSKDIVVFTIKDIDERVQMPITKQQAKAIRKHLKEAFNLKKKERSTMTRCTMSM